LSSPHLEASPATTFRACSSPAPTRVKPQPAPAILSQESVHTTLSITHHTRDRPSTGPRTTHGPHICLWMAFFCKNAIWSSLVSRMPLMFKLGACGYIFLNLCLEPCSFHLGSKIHLSSWMLSLHATLWRSLSFFLPQRHFMYHA
jgi:hypothetical protein